jgi:hypothetical protein
MFGAQIASCSILAERSGRVGRLASESAATFKVADLGVLDRPIGRGCRRAVIIHLTPPQYTVFRIMASHVKPYLKGAMLT